MMIENSWFCGPDHVLSDPNVNMTQVTNKEETAQMESFHSVSSIGTFEIPTVVLPDCLAAQVLVPLENSSNTAAADATTAEPQRKRKPGQCPHARQKDRCKECGGSAICTHGKYVLPS